METEIVYVVAQSYLHAQAAASGVMPPPTIMVRLPFSALTESERETFLAAHRGGDETTARCLLTNYRQAAANQERGLWSPEPFVSDHEMTWSEIVAHMEGMAAADYR